MDIWVLFIKNIDNLFPSEYTVRMDNLAALKAIGMTEKQALVYSALLQLGETAAYPVSRKSGLKAPTTYVILDELVSLGYASRTPRAKKQLFRALDPKKLFSHAETRFTEAKSTLPSILSLVREPSRAPVTRSFEGREQLVHAYFETLSFKDSTQYGWFSESGWTEHGLRFWMDQYRPARVKANVFNKFIVSDTPQMREYAKEDANSLKEIRIDTSGLFKPETDFFLYGKDCVILASFHEEMGVIIESARVYNLMKQIFDVHWKSLEKK